MVFSMIAPTNSSHFYEMLAMACNLMDDELAFRVECAAREAITNAQKHGNQRDDLKTICLTIHVLAESVTVEVVDSGNGFNTQPYIECLAKEKLVELAKILAESGRGTFMMATVADSLKYYAAGRHVHLSFKRRSCR